MLQFGWDRQIRLPVSSIVQLVWFKLLQQVPHTCQHLLPQAARQPGLQEPCRAQHTASQMQAGKQLPSMQVTGQAGGPTKRAILMQGGRQQQTLSTLVTKQRGQDTV